jgi:hypothetical protein
MLHEKLVFIFITHAVSFNPSPSGKNKTFQVPSHWLIPEIIALLTPHLNDYFPEVHVDCKSLTSG